MQLALFDSGSHRMQAADSATSAADALTGAISEAGELAVLVPVLGGVLAIDPGLATNFYASATGGALTVDIINHTHTLGRVRSFALDITSVGAGTLTLAGGNVFGGGFTQPVEDGLNTFVFSESASGAWQFGKVIGV